MEFTGERLIIGGEGCQADTEIYQEHLARYEFAKRFVENKIVLDIATGTGYGAAMMAAAGAAEVCGGDIDEEAIQLARQNYQRDNLHFQVMTATKMPFSDNYFDIVVSFETIEHIWDYRDFLKEIFRVLLPGGKLILSTPNRKVTRKMGIKNPFHIKEFTVEELITILAECQQVQTRGLNQRLFGLNQQADINQHNRPPRPAYAIRMRRATPPFKGGDERSPFYLYEPMIYGQREVKITIGQRIRIEAYLIAKRLGFLGVIGKLKKGGSGRRPEPTRLGMIGILGRIKKTPLSLAVARQLPSERGAGVPLSLVTPFAKGGTRQLPSERGAGDARVTEWEEGKEYLYIIVMAKKESGK